MAKKKPQKQTKRIINHQHLVTNAMKTPERVAVVLLSTKLKWSMQMTIHKDISANLPNSKQTPKLKANTKATTTKIKNQRKLNNLYM